MDDIAKDLKVMLDIRIQAVKVRVSLVGSFVRGEEGSQMMFLLTCHKIGFLVNEDEIFSIK